MRYIILVQILNLKQNIYCPVWRNNSVSCYKGSDNQQMIDIDCTCRWFAFPCLTNISDNKTQQWHLNTNEYPRILNGIASEWLTEFHWKQD